MLGKLRIWAGLLEIRRTGSTGSYGLEATGIRPRPGRPAGPLPCSALSTLTNITLEGVYRLPAEAGGGTASNLSGRALEPGH